MRVLFAGVATLLLLAAPMIEARAEQAPRVTRVLVAGQTASSATFGLDAVFHLRVSFDQSVNVTGRPQLVVEVGTQQRKLDLYAGYEVPGAEVNESPTRYLSYEYYVKASEVGSVVATGIDLNGGTITAANGESANLIFSRFSILSVDGRDRLSSPDIGWVWSPPV